jgi:hypothetical protein
MKTGIKEDIFNSAEYYLQSLYRLGAIAAALAILVTIVAAITATLSGKLVTLADAGEFFALFQQNRLIGLIDIGLLDNVLAILLIPAFVALCFALRTKREAVVSIAGLLAIAGLVSYLPTNIAVPLVYVSDRYAAATTDVAKAVALAQGQALIAMGGYGLFWSTGYIIAAVVALYFSIVMLYSQVFNRATAILGIIGNGLIIANFIAIVFVQTSDIVQTIFYSGGALFTFIWLGFVSWKLWRIGRRDRSHEKSSDPRDVDKK